jgi:Anti-sigma factor NepR
MLSVTHSALAPEPRSDAEAQAVERIIQATYQQLVSQPVPERFLDLIRTYDEKLQTFQKSRDA